MASGPVYRTRKAEHMAAPTNAAAYVRKSLPTRSRPHMALSGHPTQRTDMSAFGGKADMRLHCEMSAYDPKRTSGSFSIEGRVCAVLSLTAPVVER